MPTPELSASLDVTQHITWLPEAGSTNADLVARATADPDAWPDFSVLVTDTQRSGRGRLDRVWSTPPGSSLATSVLLRPSVPADRLGWIPLMAGLAMTRTVQMLLAGAGMRAIDATLKWPNDVLVRGLKVSGILSELIPGDEPAVVVGAGLNTSMTRDQLPVDTATSLAIECRRTYAPDTVLSLYLKQLRELYEPFAVAGDARSSGLVSQVSAACETLGQAVRVQLPDGDLVGVARGIDADGQLLVQPEGEATLRSISAGDVTHLRPLADAER
ncbi:biotin--[acetyl-CoA-carboxylase] ligase [Paramicrobacterium agarici]|uniref:biotin--[biotin carboxyl-carrier protein] ligase n=1 Tax=Paramicrobacterium agarici TaxID=630514 RepID=A0A2A9DZA0_9MICO|nr:biotin--[acetyl-CoA-carboxylase] ligase [Microbacterium agarici]PFG31923.1 BirA family biotin operon repressor/biotin-[acetyl-CoA-carboxylase] ligase [Microbacterium agarici]